MARDETVPWHDFGIGVSFRAVGDRGVEVFVDGEKRGTITTTALLLFLAETSAAIA
jgi:hypothetical protein